MVADQMAVDVHAVLAAARMAFIITGSCIGTTDGACVDVCPVDCIYSKPGDTHLFINPDECIDCAACVSECPVEAIFADSDVPAEEEEWIDRNEEEAPNLEIAMGDSPVLAD